MKQLDDLTDGITELPLRPSFAPLFHTLCAMTLVGASLFPVPAPAKTERGISARPDFGQAVARVGASAPGVNDRTLAAGNPFERAFGLRRGITAVVTNIPSSRNRLKAGAVLIPFHAISPAHHRSNATLGQIARNLRPACAVIGVLLCRCDSGLT